MLSLLMAGFKFCADEQPQIPTRVKLWKLHAPNPSPRNTMSILQQQIQELSLAEKIQLVQDLWDDIATTTDDLPLTQLQIADLDRRQKQYQAHPTDVSPWAEVQQRILDR